jgi:hypothetical protein
MQTTQTPRPIDWDAHREEKYTFWAMREEPKKFRRNILSATIYFVVDKHERPDDAGTLCWCLELIGFPPKYAQTKEELMPFVFEYFSVRKAKPFIVHEPSQPRPNVRGDWSMQIK